MYVRFWGTRGSIPTPGASTARYGGNTSCVEVWSDQGTLIVLDCGTGARGLGLHLARAAMAPLRLHLFIGHTHWDHIQGFPFFVPAFLPGTELNIYAPVGFQRSLEETLARQMEYAYFPVKLRELRSRLHFVELDEGFLRIGDVAVETQYLNHTAPTIGYRLTGNGATIAYVTDHEPFWAADGVCDHPGDRSHVAFMRGADLVIHDAQYTLEEYRQRVGWGHSTVEYAADAAAAAAARRLALFHHDPTHDDAAIERLEDRARTHVARRGASLEVFAASEGFELSVSGDGVSRPVATTSALAHRSLAGARVLLVSANGDDAGAIEELLVADDLAVITAPDVRAALARGAEATPDLAIIDTALPDGDGAGLIEPLRERLGHDFPVVLLTDAHGPGGHAHVNPARAPSDYLARPFSLPMLHARVRACLARSASGTRTVAARSGAGAGASDLAGGRPAQQAVMAALAGLPLFRGLGPSELERLVEDASDRTYPAGHVIIGEGEPDDRVFVVLAGSVRVVEAMPEALTEVVLGRVGEGEIFGEMSLLTGRPRSATVIATDRTRCLVLRHDRFREALEGSPALAVDLLGLLARRLHDTDRRLARYAPDALTGLANRRAFHDHYRRLAAAARRRKSGVLLLVVDVRELRHVNDRFGYPTGDEVLRVVADALAEGTRATDLVARYGGDEFAILLPDAAPAETETVVRRLGGKLRELVTRRGMTVDVHCRVGAAYREVPPERADELFQEADQDMRRRGRLLPD